MPSIAKKETGPLFPLPPLPGHWHSLGHAFIHQAKTRPHSPAISDSTGVEMTYHQTLVRAIVLANILHNDLGNSACVGVMLPPSAVGALVNIALTILVRIPVNLNYTVSKHVLICRYVSAVSSTSSPPARLLNGWYLRIIRLFFSSKH